MNEQKERFETPEAEVIRFEKEDVITTSGVTGGLPNFGDGGSAF